MSTENTAHKLPRKPAEAAHAIREDARYGVSFLRRHWKRLLLLFAGVLLPLWGFGELAEEVRQADPFPFDEPLLRAAQGIAGENFDKFALALDAVGYQWGVVPLDIALVVVLALTRWKREGVFAGIALGGSALLNLGAKQLFARERPSLWESIHPETTFSFPSGHAMGSMTLAAVLVLLAWRTRWRWWVAVPALAFALLVGASRVYLGVHFPSDILAGWAAACAWVVLAYLLVFHGTRPWRNGVAD